MLGQLGWRLRLDWCGALARERGTEAFQFFTQAHFQLALSGLCAASQRILDRRRPIVTRFAQRGFTALATMLARSDPPIALLLLRLAEHPDQPKPEPHGR